MFKKILKVIFGVVGFISIALCVAIGIKSPTTFTDLLGINTSSETSDIQKVPYYCNFGDLTGRDANYKSQYFDYAKCNWYLSWGSLGSTTRDDTSTSYYKTLLGWNNKGLPNYGSYSYVSQVMDNIEYTEEQNFTYLLMDFDFNLNHLMEWSFASFDGLGSENSYLHLITSHDSGSNWTITETIQLNEVIKDNEMKFTITEDSIISRTTRYGLVLVSDVQSAIRIEMNQFLVSRLSVV